MTYVKPTLDEFLDTLLNDVLTSKTFIDWRRIENFLEDYRREIALIGSLSNKEPLKDLEDLLLKYPRILELLHYLIAHEPRKLNLMDIGVINFKEDLKKLIKQDIGTAQRIARSFKKIGLIEEILSMKSVFDFSKGVMVGLEPNKRKNRRGILFQKLVPELIEKVLIDFNYGEELVLHKEGEIGMKITVGEREKYPDFGIFMKDKKKPIAFVEVNFYSSSGSKPEETLKGSYPDLQYNLRNQGIELIVITDGMGWRKMKNGLKVALERLNYLMNLSLAKRGKLKEALLEILKVN